MEDERITLDFSRLRYESSSLKAHSFSTGHYKGKYSGVIHLPKSISKHAQWRQIGGPKKLLSVSVPVWWWDKLGEDNFAKGFVEVIEEPKKKK